VKGYYFKVLIYSSQSKPLQLNVKSSQVKIMTSKHHPSPSAFDTDIELPSQDLDEAIIKFPLKTPEKAFNEYFSEATLCTLQTLNSSTPRRILIQLAPEVVFDTDAQDPCKRPERLLSIASGGSNFTSEDLIMNENIDFLYESSEKVSSTAYSPSFNYTKSDKSSSVFETFYSPKLLMQSLPLSHTDSDIETSFYRKKNCETQNPGFLMERLDLQGFEMSELDENTFGEGGFREETFQHSEEKEASRMEKQKILMQMKGIFLNNRKSECEDSSGLFEIADEKDLETHKEWGCGIGCSKCSIM
jgi:hypothetical protein